MGSVSLLLGGSLLVGELGVTCGARLASYSAS